MALHRADPGLCAHRHLASAPARLLLGRARRPARRVFHLPVRQIGAGRHLVPALVAGLDLRLRLPVLHRLRAAGDLRGRVVPSFPRSGLRGQRQSGAGALDRRLGLCDVRVCPLVAGAQCGAGGRGRVYGHPLPPGGCLRARRAGRVGGAGLPAAGAVGFSRDRAPSALGRDPGCGIRLRRDHVDEQPGGADFHAGAGGVRGDLDLLAVAPAAGGRGGREQRSRCAGADEQRPKLRLPCAALARTRGRVRPRSGFERGVLCPGAG